MKNYRPNFPYVSKLLEKAAANQIMNEMYSNDVQESLQSDNRPGHSTETAVGGHYKSDT